MTLVDLLTTLETRGVLHASRVKDMKTSIKYLAAALGIASPEQCPLDTACRDPATWATALETHFQALETQGKTISAVTRRNTRNNLRVLFRQAEAHGLLQAPLPPRLLTKPKRAAFMRQLRAATPYPMTYRIRALPRYSLPLTAWPAEIVQGFREYKARCGMRIRDTSFQSYEKWMGSYLGYLIRICGRTPAWDDLFAVPTLLEFVRWHAARLHRASTVHGKQVVILLAAMAKVMDHPQTRALADFRNELKPPTPLHNKRAHWVSLATLEEVAEACIAESHAPLINAATAQHPGLLRALAFQRGLILKLLVRVPLRQRNVREMQLGTNLAKDRQTGQWHLAFSGEELKVGYRGAQVNKYEVNLSTYCPEFIPVLEEFLAVFRPKLPNAASSRCVFLNHNGKPLSAQHLQVDLSAAVAMRTGQRFYPHLVRTIWATEYLEKTQNFTTAAVLLGDTVRTVMTTYYDVINKNHHANAKAFLDTALHTG